MASNRSTDDSVGMRGGERDFSRLVSAARAALAIRLVMADPGVESRVTSHWNNIYGNHENKIITECNHTYLSPYRCPAD